MSSFETFIASELNVDVKIAAFTHCDRTWRDIDYIPGYNKFLYICHGEGVLKIDGREYSPLPGQMYLMPQGVVQSYFAINDNTFRKYWCHFTAKAGPVNLFDVIKLPDYITVKNKEPFESAFKAIIKNNNESDIASRLRANAALTELIVLYMEASGFRSEDRLNGRPNERMAQILEYIETHLSENLTVLELAKIACLHPNYFIKFFKKHTGMAPIRYINRMRLERAKKLIMCGDYSVSALAFEVGFNDPNHFSKLFKSFTGFAPSEFQKICNQNES